MNTTTNQANPELVAYCGLYCGSCKRYQKGGCPGCKENTKATWCKIRTCCQDKAIESCALCDLHESVSSCKLHRHPLSLLIGWVTRTDRPASVALLKEKGALEFAKYMYENSYVSIPKHKKKLKH